MVAIVDGRARGYGRKGNGGGQEEGEAAQDNGVGRTVKAPTPGRTSLGLKLTGERLELLTERMRSAGGFRVEDLKDPSGAPAGTLVEMRFAG